MAINDLIRPFAQRMTIETSITPPIDVDDPFGPTEGPGAVAQGKAALALLKPKITLYGAGGDPIIWSPYGEPSIFGVAGGAIFGAGILFLAGYGAYKLIFDRKKKKK